VLTSAMNALPEDIGPAIVLRDGRRILDHPKSRRRWGSAVANVKTRVHRGRLFLRSACRVRLDGGAVAKKSA